MPHPPATRPPTPAGAPSPRRWGERGSLTLFTVVVALALLLALGLVIDGSAKLRAGSEASAVAAAAARAAAGRVDESQAYGGGRYRLAPAAAAAAARRHLAATGHQGTVTVVGPRTVRVRVTVSRPTVLLGLIGITSVQGTGTATADLTPGVDAPLAQGGV